MEDIVLFVVAVVFLGLLGFLLLVYLVDSLLSALLCLHETWVSVRRSFGLKGGDKDDGCRYYSPRHRD